MSPVNHAISNRHPRRTPPRKCLFCMGKGSAASANWFSSELPGAVKCSELQRELQNMFILRQLLNIPSSLCKESLETNAWFQICNDCFQLVDEAWLLYQRLLGIETRITEIQDVIRRKIVESSQQNFGGVGEGFLGHAVFWKIRRCFSLEQVQPDSDFGDFAEPMEGDIENDNDNDKDFVPTSEQMTCVSDTGGNGNDSDYKPRVSTKEVSKSDKQKCPTKRRYFRRTLKPRSRSTTKRIRVWKTRYTWLCDICPTRYKTEDELSKHKGVHEQSKLNNHQFDCSECNYPLSSKAELESHVERTHARYFKCKVRNCAYKTRFYYKFGNHAGEKHPNMSLEECGVDGLECAQCNLKLANRSAWVIHRRRMHPEMFGAVPNGMQEFSCEECGQKFSNKFLLENHKRAHTKQQKLEYFCEICGKGYHWLSRLNIHMKIHSSKEYMCEICGTDYFSRNGLKKHYRVHHPGKQTKFQNNQNPSDDIKFPVDEGEEYSARDTQIKEYLCKVCEISIPYTHRTRHLKEHIEATGFQCDICMKSYASVISLKRHKSINHSNQEVKCPYCLKAFPHQDYVKAHYKFCQLKAK